MRIQRSRARGWRMPPGAVSVTRPGPFGNPWVIAEIADNFHVPINQARVLAVQSFRAWLDGQIPADGYPGTFLARERLLTSLPTLRGKVLACWCPLTLPDSSRCPCHADVLLEIANG